MASVDNLGEVGDFPAEHRECLLANRNPSALLLGLVPTIIVVEVIGPYLVAESEQFG